MLTQGRIIVSNVVLNSMHPVYTLEPQSFLAHWIGAFKGPNVCAQRLSLPLQWPLRLTLVHERENLCMGSRVLFCQIAAATAGGQSRN